LAFVTFYLTYLSHNCGLVLILEIEEDQKRGERNKRRQIGSAMATMDLHAFFAYSFSFS
jgi:hypothetical protein